MDPADILILTVLQILAMVKSIHIILEALLLHPALMKLVFSSQNSIRTEMWFGIKEALRPTA